MDNDHDAIYGKLTDQTDWKLLCLYYFFREGSKIPQKKLLMKTLSNKKVLTK